MPSFVASPLELRITGYSPALLPARFTPDGFALTVAFPTVKFGPGSPNISGPVTVPKLDRLQRQEKIVGSGGEPSGRFQDIWQQTMEAIEAAFGGQQGQITDLATIVARLEAAEQLASSAQAQAADTAYADALAQSYREPQGILIANPAGTVLIAAHTLFYGDGRSVALSAGSVSGFVPGDYVQIFYDDAARAGGAVTYQGTTGTVAQQGARHIVGGASIPQAGQPPSSGNTAPPPGYVRGPILQ